MTFKESIVTTGAAAPEDIAYPSILIVGPSGSGKTRSTINLPPESTAFLNIENKTLTFPGADKMADVRVNASNAAAALLSWDEIIEKALAADEIKYIVLDSMLKYNEFYLNYSRGVNKGFDIWSAYNMAIFKLLEKVKTNKKKFMIVMFIDEILTDTQVDGTSIRKRFASVRGKEWEGKIEKEFPIVLFTHVEFNSDKKPSYHFVTETDGTTTAKTPEGMFSERLIPNDIKAVCDKAEEYYKLK